MDAESGDYDKDGLTSERGGELRQDWLGWRMNMEVDSKDDVMQRSVLVGEKGYNNRWGAGTARGLKRVQVVKRVRLTGCKNFVRKIKKFIFNAFVDLKPVERFENRSDMWGFRSLNSSTSKDIVATMYSTEIKYITAVALFFGGRRSIATGSTAHTYDKTNLPHQNRWA